MFTDGGAVDDTGDGDELLAGRVWPLADARHQQRPTRQGTAGAYRYEARGQEDDEYRNQDQQHA
ncbi:hypothetical protein MKUB_13860 [Mycobacterium kubicae]|uniref:Uncharacterized protein n=1 Tax=Mycobacterium kubicae TaxID=120959 RepID=A0ABQ1BJR8_9MYCO|nr:hypothetical protein MKUB_13860 [Mycobacterium kubicae]